MKTTLKICPFLLTTILLLLFTNISCNRSPSLALQKEATFIWKLVEEQSLPDEFFKDIPAENRNQISYSLFNVNQIELDKSLSLSPNSKDINALDSEHIIFYPHPSGVLIPFKMVSTILMEKDLADKYPELKTYEGVSSLSANTLIRITRNDLGIDAMILSTEGTYYIHALELDNQLMYLVYFKSDFNYNITERLFEPIRK